MCEKIILIKDGLQRRSHNIPLMRHDYEQNYHADGSRLIFFPTVRFLENLIREIKTFKYETEF